MQMHSHMDENFEYREIGLVSYRQTVNSLQRHRKVLALYQFRIIQLVCIYIVHEAHFMLMFNGYREINGENFSCQVTYECAGDTPLWVCR